MRLDSVPGGRTEILPNLESTRRTPTHHTSQGLKRLKDTDTSEIHRRLPKKQKSADETHRQRTVRCRPSEAVREGCAMQAVGRRPCHEEPAAAYMAVVVLGASCSPSSSFSSGIIDAAASAYMAVVDRVSEAEPGSPKDSFLSG